MPRSRGRGALPGVSPLSLIFALHLLVLLLSGKGWGVQAVLAPLNDIDTVFVFGDSYSETGFDPSKGFDPLAQPAKTTSAGPSWPMYFANNTISPALFNRTFSFARGGATTSPDRVYPTYPNISTGSQVDSWEGWFVNATTEGKKARPVWDGRKTLFVVSFGLNDLVIAMRSKTPLPTILEPTFAELMNQTSRLYKSGARQFLFQLIPAFQHSPEAQHSFPDVNNAAALVGTNVKLWNERVKVFAGQVASTLKGSEVGVWDAYGFWEELLAHPQAYGFRNSTDYCPSYAPLKWKRGQSLDYYKKDCGIPLRDYIWMDRAHPTFTVHKLIADSLVKVLSQPGASATTSLHCRNSIAASSHSDTTHLVTHHRAPVPIHRQPSGMIRQLVRRKDGFWAALRDQAVGSVVGPATGVAVKVD
ncbi:hypothetical protein NBRC10512_005459 [Rhodotorula toruloides]|uniref:RHTO0S22e01310g1_1 n=2 Tax=Rhodotorula toruloides TaxID=5286 RepID=A0A061BG99_RHOTO|nr:Lipase, GDSL domain containing protein, carbohydrate Esterase Family 16 protein [Rhodotorula toruloides NP11]EMS18917.1 Lipase, GDSL domain containing protein, carbohydrate Esterase Family 16 protein [Rhodotorula toruloides NP11]CDR49015.1 RHTO0S22e01310g1_1 [Rhodotorula toruloides]